jgi:hypothetical protein
MQAENSQSKRLFSVSRLVENYHFPGVGNMVYGFSHALKPL